MGADTFTMLDLRSAYMNLRVAERDEDKLAFICHAGQFTPLTMPFGPTGEPGYFEYFIQDILLGWVGKDVAAYLDNITPGEILWHLNGSATVCVFYCNPCPMILRLMSI